MTKFNSVRLELPKKLGLVRSWHWSVYQQIFAAKVGFLGWYEFWSLEYSHH